MASLTLLNLIVLPAFISSSDCCKDLRSRTFGISDISYTTDKRFADKVFQKAFITALSESPNPQRFLCFLL